MGTLQQHSDGLDLHEVLLFPQRRKMPVRAVLSARETESAEGCVADSGGKALTIAGK